MKRPSWNELQAVKVVAGQRSFSRAAAVLGLKRSTLSHMIKGLEATLGVQLFHRTTRSVALTEAGEMLIARMNPLLAEMDELLNDVTASAQQPYGTLRISASDAAQRLIPDVNERIREHLMQYPELMTPEILQDFFPELLEALERPKH